MSDEASDMAGNVEEGESIEYIAVNDRGDTAEITRRGVHEFHAMYECVGVQYAQVDLEGVSIVEMTMQVRNIDGFEFTVPVLFELADFISIHEFQAKYVEQVKATRPDGEPREEAENDVGRAD